MKLDYLTDEENLLVSHAIGGHEKDDRNKIEELWNSLPEPVVRKEIEMLEAEKKIGFEIILPLSCAEARIVLRLLRAGMEAVELEGTNKEFVDDLTSNLAASAKFTFAAHQFRDTVGNA